MRSLALAALLVGLSTTAFAGDAPKIIGTWVPVSFISAHDGTGGVFADEATPVFTKDAGEGWNLTIDAQDGPAFSGTDKGGPKGARGALVGVFRMDGQRFVMATDTGSAQGQVMGDQLEICWEDKVPNLIAVGCSVYKRQ
jgi:hypothetical protein